ncbi:MAG: peptidylprolyl isomerase [Actinobacteria bacterium]|nr:peptidylprolyl isomerase [Actinomycetota bacterium]
MRRLVIPAVAFALLAAACSGPGAEEVARVNDVVITVDDVSALYDATEIPIDGNYRLAVFRLIAIEVLEDAAQADFGLTVDDAEVEATYEQFAAEVAEFGSNIPDEFDEDAVLRFDARLTVLRDAVIDALVTDPDLIAGLQTTLAEDPAALTTVCARHILVDTEEGITAARDRVEAGEDFGTVADEVSLDESPGGDLGCNPPGLFVQEFADATMEAEVGTLYGPFQTGYGYHLLIVDDRTTPTADDLAADPGAYVDADTLQQLWVEWLDSSLAAEDITVNPDYGVWDEATQRIVAPAAEG